MTEYELTYIEKIPCSNPNCDHGWDDEMHDVCEKCYGRGHHEKTEECLTADLDTG